MSQFPVVRRRSILRRAILPIAVAVFAASCGGGDDDATVDDATASSSGSVATSDADNADQPAQQGAPSCSEIFSDEEIEEFFAEPAELTENDVVTGLLQCTWETIEDEDDLEDLALQMLIVQLYFGPTVDVSTVFDPTLYEPVATIADVGDEAWVADAGGVSKQYLFVDGDTAGMLLYQEINMGDGDDVHSADDAEQLLRTFHERVT